MVRGSPSFRESALFIMSNPFHSKAYRYNRPKKQGSPEGHLVMQIIHYLKAKGYAVGKTKTMGVVRNGRYTYDPYQFRGFPDISAFIPELIFIECKSPKGRQTEEQKDFQSFCEKAGIRYILARSFADIQIIFP